MCYYVEYLRVVRGLRIVGIVLGLLLLAALVIRFSFGAPAKPPGPAHDRYYLLEHSKTAHVTHRRLPHGIVRTIVDDPQNEVYAYIDRHGSSVVEFDYAHTRQALEAQLRREGPTHELTYSGTTVAYSNSDLGALFSATIPIGLLLATLLGGPLSKENSGHLELAWTKPVSRERYALTAVLVDAGGLIVAQAATAVTLLLASSLWELPHLRVEHWALVLIALALTTPIAWYAFLTALSASFKRGPGVAVGVGWVVAFVVPYIATTTDGASTPLGRAVHAVFDGTGHLIPLWWVWDRLMYDNHAVALSTALAASAALAVVYVAVAVVQWRRMEA